MSIENQVSELAVTVDNLAALVTRFLEEGGAAPPPTGEPPAGDSSLLIDAPLTLTVGLDQEFLDIQAAWESLKGKVIIADVTIAVIDGTHPTIPMTLSGQPYADRIRIIGNVAAPENCVLQYLPPQGSPPIGLSGLITVEAVSTLNISGFTLHGGVAAPAGFGLLVTNRAQVESDGNSIIIDGCETAVRVENGGVYTTLLLRTVNCQDGVLVDAARAILPLANFSGGGGGAALKVINTGFCEAEKAQAAGFSRGYVSQYDSLLFVKGAVADVSSSGFSCRWGGRLNANRAADGTAARAINAEEEGFAVEEDGVMQCEQATAENIEERGFIAATKACMYATNSSAINCGTGYRVSELSVMFARNTDSGSSGNGTLYQVVEDVDASAQPELYQ